ncbi:hypothetical protein [Burkholderia cepacia]|nr:hypothetical protein [Burkholderia cepacia]
MSDSRPLSQTTFRPQVVPPSLAADKRTHLLSRAPGHATTQAQ